MFKFIEAERGQAISLCSINDSSISPVLSYTFTKATCDFK